ncbi:MAG: hypothetical protein R2798_06940 [Chitinophagales bacterium]
MKKLMFLCMLGGIIFALSHVDANAQQAQRVKSGIEQPSKQEKVANSNVVKTTTPTVQQKEALPVTTVLPINGKAGSCAVATPQSKVTQIPKAEAFEELYAGEREFMENLKKTDSGRYSDYLENSQKVRDLFRKKIDEDKKEEALRLFKEKYNIK